MCRYHRIKRLVPCWCRTGTLKNPAKCLWRWEPDRGYNFFWNRTLAVNEIKNYYNQQSGPCIFTVCQSILFFLLQLTRTLTVQWWWQCNDVRHFGHSLLSRDCIWLKYRCMWRKTTRNSNVWKFWTYTSIEYSRILKSTRRLKTLGYTISNQNQFDSLFYFLSTWIKFKLTLKNKRCICSVLHRMTI